MKRAAKATHDISIEIHVLQDSIAAKSALHLFE
jgi:hypothetical protein